MSEINWKDKCADAAAWLGAIYHRADDSMYSTPYTQWFTDGANSWPDFTKCHAAPWVLLRELHAKVEPPLSSGADGTYRVEVWKNCKLLAMAEHESLAKALVLATSELFKGEHTGRGDE